MSVAANSSLRKQQHPLIRQLAESIEKICLYSYIDLSPYNFPVDLGYVEGKVKLSSR